MEPCLPHAAQAVRTRKRLASSRASRMGRRDLCGSTGDAAAECTGVAGPADDGAVEKYSLSQYEDGVRQMDGIGDSGGEPAPGGDAGASWPWLLVSGAKSKSSRSRSRLCFSFEDRGAVPRSVWRWRRGQLVGEKAPMVSSVPDATGSTGEGLGRMPRGRVRKW